MLTGKRPGELVGPIATGSGWRLVQLRERVLPRASDPQLRARAIDELLDDALAPASRGTGGVACPPLSSQTRIQRDRRRSTRRSSDAAAARIPARGAADAGRRVLRAAALRLRRDDPSRWRRARRLLCPDVRAGPRREAGRRRPGGLAERPPRGRVLRRGGAARRHAAHRDRARRQRGADVSASTSPSSWRSSASTRRSARRSRCRREPGASRTSCVFTRPSPACRRQRSRRCSRA